MPALVLASGSATRARLLREAGVVLDVAVAAIDESEILQSLRRDGAAPDRVAETLAELKAQRVSGRYPGRLVLGADQMLDCGGTWLEKPGDLAEARAHLLLLRGRRHRLVSSAVLVRDGVRLWHHTATADLEMRDFSDAFLDTYLTAAGAAVLGAVGGYQLESLGAQLFRRIDGDFFTVLGLPLLPVLDILREQGMLQR
jgi:septum formation protein